MGGLHRAPRRTGAGAPRGRREALPHAPLRCEALLQRQVVGNRSHRGRPQRSRRRRRGGAENRAGHRLHVRGAGASRPQSRPAHAASPPDSSEAARGERPRQQARPRPRGPAAYSGERPRHRLHARAPHLRAPLRLPAVARVAAHHKSKARPGRRRTRWRRRTSMCSQPQPRQLPGPTSSSR